MDDVDWWDFGVGFLVGGATAVILGMIFTFIQNI